MLKSMTGFGKAFASTNDATVAVEIKSLNSRFIDLNLNLPRLFSHNEPDVRNWVSERLERGKITVIVEYKRIHTLIQPYDETLFITHYSQLKKLADKVMAPYDNLFQLALNASKIVKEQETATPEEWKWVKKSILEALEECDQFRTREGSMLQKKMYSYCESILAQLAAVESANKGRAEKIKIKIKEKIAEYFDKVGLDENRLEQEILFYSEKIDISEEQVRLKIHLDFLKKALNNSTSSGKKLNFITQEIGREINTIGSKANDAKIQQYVVTMKEDLEKLKEQLNNIV